MNEPPFSWDTQHSGNNGRSRAAETTIRDSSAADIPWARRLSPQAGSMANDPLTSSNASSSSVCARGSASSDSAANAPVALSQPELRNTRASSQKRTQVSHNSKDQLRTLGTELRMRQRRRPGR